MAFRHLYLSKLKLWFSAVLNKQDYFPFVSVRRL